MRHALSQIIHCICIFVFIYLFDCLDSHYVALATPEPLCRGGCGRYWFYLPPEG